MFSTLSIAFIIGIIVAHNSASILACSLIVAVAVILHNILGLALGYGLSALTGSESPKRSAIAIDAYSGGYPFSISGDIRSVPS